MQALLILGDNHHRYSNSSEIIRLQHEEILVRGREVQSLKQRLAEVEDLLVRRDADVEKKTAELEGRTDELERIRTLNGQLEGKLEDSSVEVRGLQGQVQDFQGQVRDLQGEVQDLKGEVSSLRQKNEEMIVAAEKDKEAVEEYYKDLLFDGFYHVSKLNKPLDLSFRSEDEQAEELAHCERRAREEAYTKNKGVWSI
jgi:chromosome segregation ATPase